MASQEYRHAHARRKPGASRAVNQATQPEFLSTGQVADLAESMTGKRPSPSTITRWMLRGARGNRLQSRRIGGRLYAPRHAALEWLGGYGDSGLSAEPHDASAAVASLLGRQWGTAAAKSGNHSQSGGAE